ncbi:uncharacterized protein FIBRA_06806 [Fibroporia radiculosa]|uniref:Chromosome segregation in meiosis protein n=1 Tax=Fibroporia radiculosa TaxID=599839 RepID=J4HZP1_9APHY|nr:uncharacterized protein FIBRA_06806 [Fibroporia radiculosa]CCM04622.1 predicted protein [Fibroporia radiculosa]
MDSVALENIWDAPVLNSPPRSSAVSTRESPTSDNLQARPSKRPRSSLFLDSDSDDAGDQQTAEDSGLPPSNKAEIDAMFDSLDDAAFEDLPAPLDLGALRRQEDAKNAKAFPEGTPLDGVSGSTQGNLGDGESKEEKGAKEKRKPLPKLDEARLLGPDGFPTLVKQVKNFKPKGKGHEVTDLNRLLQVYQFWGHKMYPKMPFRDTVQRVEKLCHSKRMNVALSVWRDESKGLVNGRKIDMPSDSDSGGSDGDEEDAEAKQTPSGNTKDTTDNMELPSSRAPSQPPSSASEPSSSDALDDFDIDAIIREEEQRATVAHPPSNSGSTYLTREPPQAMQIDTAEDEALWDDLMNDLPDSTQAASIQATHPVDRSRSFQPHDSDGDEDMWDVVRELEAASSTHQDTPGSATTVINIHHDEQPPPQVEASAAIRPTNEEGWDEMYL